MKVKIGILEAIYNGVMAVFPLSVWKLCNHKRDLFRWSVLWQHLPLFKEITFNYTNNSYKKFKLR